MNIRNLANDLERIINILLAENNRQQVSMSDIESDFSLVTLLALLKSFDKGVEAENASAEQVKTLTNYLATRWVMLRKTSQAYPYAPRDLSSVACLLLAQELESVTNQSRYKLLMPTIKVDRNEISATEIRENALQLHEFVLSDDDDRIIDILPCLEFASEDGVLKHTSLFDGRPKKLSETEAKRVIYHSPQSKAYYDSICEKVAAKTRSTSFGAVLTRLSAALRAGGIHGQGNGEELNAGHNANEGIFIFSQWLQALDESERAQLFACRAPGLTDSMGDIWGRLARPNDVNYKQTIFCVALMSSGIDQILAANRHLFDLYPKNNQAAHTKEIEVLEQAVNSAKLQFIKALRGPDYHVNVTERAADSTVLFQYMSTRLTQFMQDISCLNENTLKLQQRVQQWLPTNFDFQDAHSFLATLGRLPEYSRIWMLKLFIDKLPSIFPSRKEFSILYYGYTVESFKPVLLEQFRKMVLSNITNAAELYQALLYFPINERMRLMADMQIDLSSLFTNGKELFSILLILPQQERVILLNTLNNKLGNIIKDCGELANTLGCLNNIDRIRVINYVNPQIDSLIQNIQEFQIIIPFIALENRMHLITMLKPELYLWIENGDQLGFLLGSLETSERGTLINELGKDLKAIIQISSQLILCLAMLKEADQALLIKILGDELKEIIFSTEELASVNRNLSVQNRSLLEEFYHAPHSLAEQQGKAANDSKPAMSPQRQHESGGIFSFFRRILHLPSGHHHSRIDREAENDKEELKHKHSMGKK